MNLLPQPPRKSPLKPTLGKERDMKLEEIGFYTLSDYRANQTSVVSPLWRCELLVTDKCNFKCPYCRGMRPDLKGVLSLKQAKYIVDLWANEGLKNIRFSGGEPTTWKPLLQLIGYTKNKGIERIAVSTNGSANLSLYKNLLKAGVNDFSISLDACCSAFGEIMNGGIKGAWKKTIKNIEKLSAFTYVTVGMVFTELNMHDAIKSIMFAHKLGVSDIRIISSAQYNEAIRDIALLPEAILNAHPILKYRVTNYKNKRNVRGIQEKDSHNCHLVLDDMAIAQNYHFPCIIYLREMGNPIGKIDGDIRYDRFLWSILHDTHKDPICRNNCLDVCIDYNNKTETPLVLSNKVHVQ